MLWPTVTLVGFFAMAGLVIALGRGSTARYELERNRVRQPAAVPSAPAAASPVGAPLGDAVHAAPGLLASEGDGAAPGVAVMERTAVAVDGSPAGRRPRESAPAWWLVDEDGDEEPARVVAGPFADRFEAEWTALASGLPTSTVPVHGGLRADGALLRRPSPDETAWLAELGEHLERLPEDWDELLTDAGALTTLVVEVSAALVEAGLPLHDCTPRHTDRDRPTGGVCLTPDGGSAGVLVTWRSHDRMSLHEARGAAAGALVQETMTAAVAAVLVQLGFAVELVGPGACYRVTPRA
jgi:hypothetical protein